MTSPNPSTVRLTLAYDGTLWAGWQRQHDVATVQQMVEDAVSKLLRTDVVVQAAGRTDAGVHALGQVGHLSRRGAPGEPLPILSAKALVTGTNHFLPRQIRVLEARRLDVSETPFHARKSATAKQYVYRIVHGGVAAPFDAPFALHLKRRLDTHAVREALRHLPGRHDFSAFAIAGGSHTQGVRRLFSARLDESPDQLRLELWGEGFLRGMVRSLVGTLVEIGRGDRPPDDLTRLLEPGRTRDESGFTAAAHGLRLERVVYPDVWPVLERWGD